MPRIVFITIADVEPRVNPSNMHMVIRFPVRKRKDGTWVIMYYLHFYLIQFWLQSEIVKPETLPFFSSYIDFMYIV